MIFDKANKVIQAFFESHLYRYQIGLETSNKCSDFNFDCVSLLHYKCHKINLNRGGLYLDSHNWIKTKKATTDPVNDDDKFFQYTTTHSHLKS